MKSDQISSFCVTYLVHDIDDTAVCRRVELLAAEGVAVHLGGFRRRPGGIPNLPVNAVTDLGRTRDAHLMQRMGCVIRHLARPRALKTACAGTSAIVARNLEMLLLAFRGRTGGQRLVYECLDIHRLMLGEGLASRFLRWLERALLARTDLVIVSSPAFGRNYFAARQERHERVLLVENKMPGRHYHAGRDMPLSGMPRRSSSRLVIGWFGMLRCRRTLRQLISLAATSAGNVEILLAGIPSPAEFPEFAKDIADAAGVRYFGPYEPRHLADLYAGVDLVWAIDYFEEGLNSAWLLPNRLYEGLAHGAVPIALRNVETGKWLLERNVGLLVDDAEVDVPRILDQLTPVDLHEMREAVGNLPRDALYQTDAERRSIADAIAGRGNG